MDFRILGTLEVLDEGRPVSLGGSRQRALLALLLLHVNETITSDRLLDELWGERRPATAAKTVQVHVSRLRKALADGGAAVVTRPHGYELKLEPERLDAHRFEVLVGEGRGALAAGRPENALARLEDALALWRGAPLSDVADEPFAQAAIARLDDLRIAALEDLVEAKLALGRHAEVVGQLEALIGTHPYRERLRAQLMLALYRSDRQADALQAYQDARKSLVEQLGIEPGERLRELERAILAQDPHLALRTADGKVVAAPRPRPVTEGLVGRSRELSELLPIVDGALAGSGATILIGGEPGIGKSRLADTLARYAHEQGARIAVGRCWESGGAPAYWPWTQALGAYVRGAEAQALRLQLGSDGPELVAILPELGPIVAARSTRLGEEGARFRLFQAVASFMRRAAAAAPVALFVDDLHAADLPSLLLLRFVAAELAEAQVLFVACYRDTEVSPGTPLGDTLPDLVRDRSVHRLTLRGLDEADTGRLLELSTGRAPSPRLTARVHAQTEGNPLFAGEVARLLADADATPGARAQLPIPAGIHEAIGRRLRRRSEVCNRALMTASVLGREFALETLERVSDLERDEVHGGVEEAIAARLLDAVPGIPGRLRFSHVLIRDVVYESLPATRRPRLHLDVAQTLERMHAANLDPYLAELAHHCLLAGSEARKHALAYSVRAGDRAASQVGYEEAAHHYQTALGLLEATRGEDERTTAEVWLSLGEVLGRAGSDVEAKESFRRAAAIAKALGRPDLLARAAIGYGGRFVWPRAGTDPALVPLLESALSALGEADSPERARLLSRLSTALRDEPTRERRVRLAGDAVAMTRRLGDPATLAYALDAHWSAVDGPDDVGERIGRADELLELAERLDDHERVLDAREYRASTFWMLGDRAGVDVELAAMRRLADALRQPAQHWIVGVYEAMVALLEGRLGTAEQLISAALEVGRQAASWNAVKAHRLQLFVLRREQGRLAELEATLRRSLHEYAGQQAFPCMLAHLYAEVGDDGEAHAMLDSLLARDLRRSHVDEEWLYGVSLLPDVCARLDDVDAAARLYDVLLPFRRLYAFAAPGIAFGAVARPLGVLASTMGRFAAAEEHLRAAVEMERGMAARPAAAHAERDLAGMHVARGEPDDRQRAQALLLSAASAYEELGMESWAARARIQL